MEAVGGPDAKKARWSPTSFGSNALNGLSNSAATRDAFANYGYGPQASISQCGYNNSSPSNGFGGSPLYATPSLSINTNTNGNGMASQMSPNTASFPQQQQPSPNGNTPYGFGSYNMVGMGMPGMNMMGGFPYNGQMGGFPQVDFFFLNVWDPSLVLTFFFCLFFPATPSFFNYPPVESRWSSVRILTCRSFCCTFCVQQHYRTDCLCRKPSLHCLR